MAIRNKTNLPLAPIPYTKEIDNGTDFTALANSTYFKDTTDGLVYFKDGTGSKISLFSSGGGATEVGTGADSLQQVGVGANAVGVGAISLGVNSSTSFTKNVSIGHTAISSGQQSIALGTATATATGAIAIGNTANATGAGSISMGNGSDATVGTGSIAIGQTAQATAQGAVALGYLAGNLGAGTTSVAIGQSSEASANDCVAIGNLATAKTGVRNIAIGQSSQSTGSQASVAIGENAISSSSQSIAVGYRTRATSFNSVAIGSTAESNTGNYGISIGDAALTTGAQGVSIGQAASATNTRAICIGHNIKATAVNAIMIGGSTAAKTNVTADSVEFNFNEATSTIRLAKAADSWWNGTGDFGIGLTAPSAKLHVKGIDQLGTSSALLVQDSTGASLLDVRNDGFVGIGAVAPTKRLHIDGTGSNEMLRLSKSGVAQLDLGYYTWGGYLWLNDPTGTNKVKINAAASDFIDTGKNFGLGIQAPAHKLHINDTVTNGIIRLSKSGVTQSDLGYYTSGGYLWLNDAAGTGKVKINATTVDFIDTGKNFGLGIQAPTAKLHVVGSTLLNGNLGVFGTTPIAQPTTGVASAVIGAGAGTNALQDDTYGGYTMAQVVQALQNLGVLA